MAKLEELKAAITNTGETLENYLTRKYFTGKWRVKGEIFIYTSQVRNLTNAIEYQWGSDKQGFYTINSEAQMLTPQLNRRGIEFFKASGKVDPYELAIYNRWNELFVEQDDVEIITRMIMKEFELPMDKVVGIYQRIGQYLS